MNRLISPERKCLHYYLGRLLWTQGNDCDLASMLLLKLDSLLEGILFVRVDYELSVCGINRLPIGQYPDPCCGVRDAQHTDDNFQQPTTFPSRNPRDA